MFLANIKDSNFCREHCSLISVSLFYFFYCASDCLWDTCFSRSLLRGTILLIAWSKVWSRCLTFFAKWLCPCSIQRGESVSSALWQNMTGCVRAIRFPLQGMWIIKWKRKLRILGTKVKIFIHREKLEDRPLGPGNGQSWDGARNKTMQEVKKTWSIEKKKISSGYVKREVETHEVNETTYMSLWRIKWPMELLWF